MIVIPMAGESRRFRDAGYDRPKHELMLDGASVFDHAVGSFEAYFRTLPFLFVVRAEAAAFVEAATARLGISDARIAVLGAQTAGQAETVARGVDRIATEDDAPLTIFNIDTFRPGFIFPDTDWTVSSDGWLEVFRGEGANWSYVRPASPLHRPAGGPPPPVGEELEITPQNSSPIGGGGPPAALMNASEPLALETAEKRPISNLCCTGLYHFARAGDFRRALARERAAPSMPELYVAPLYNHLIAEGRRIHYRTIEHGAVIFCGVPAEYEALKAQMG